MRPRLDRGRGQGSQLKGYGAWSRGRLIGMLVASCAVGLVLVAGLLFGMVDLVRRPSDPRTGSAAPRQTLPSGQSWPVAPTSEAGTDDRMQARDLIAAEAMPRVPEQAMLPPEDPLAQTSAAHPASVVPATIEIPNGQDPGPASVLTGYPHTPEGAVGQLAQIETTVLQAMSLDEAQEVYRSWALPGGPGARSWTLTQNVASFLTSAGMGGAKDPSSVVTAEPVGALVKGVDGDDWNVACVLVEVTAVYRQKDQVAYGHCERMQWQADRWMIAPGLPPAPAPSTWPGTSWATSAGWRAWVSTAGVGNDR